MRVRRPYFKQKPKLYFDENFPIEVTRHFCFPYWKKKIKVTSAIQQGYCGRSDRFHHAYCTRHDHTLVTLDLDFNNDRIYPFTHGPMGGIIMIRGSVSEATRIIQTLAQLMDFILSLPLPKLFLGDTKFIAALDGVTIRGRDAATREIKTLRVTTGATTRREICEFFSY